MSEVDGGASFDVDAVERWFVRRGVPQAIFHYNATEDVFTRMVPFCAVVFLFGAMAALGDRFSGWSQFGIAAAAASILIALALILNRLRGRRLFALPSSIGGAEVTVFLIGAPLIALLFGDERLFGALTFLIGNAVLLGVAYLTTTYGLVPMFAWGLREVGVQVRGLTRLLGKSLPLLLLFATFLFINAEMWQVAHDLSPAFYTILIAMILLPAAVFLVLRSPDEVANLHSFRDWAEIDEIVDGTDAPLPPHQHTHMAGGVPEAVVLEPLDGGEQRNIALLMLMAQLVQIVLVAAVIGAFFVLFGLLAVREETIVQWTEFNTGDFAAITRFTFLGEELVVTWELFAVSGFIAAISALQFSVSLISDELYREQFFSSLEREVREVLAVRARYLEAHGRAPARPAPT